MPAEQSQSPLLARHLVKKHLYRGEHYYLIIDSHTLFTPRWDVDCIRMWTQARSRSPKSILTMYPGSFKLFRRRRPKRGYENRPPGYVRFLKFVESTGLVHTAGFAMQRIPEQPVPSLFWVACYSFGLGSQIREVPFDPFCPYVFVGEEISMTARLWTHGSIFSIPHAWSCITCASRGILPFGSCSTVILASTGSGGSRSRPDTAAFALC